MTNFYRRLQPVLFAAILATASGCGLATTPPAPLTPAQYFKERQTNTMTPNGKILMDSVQEKDGQIEYQTEDGKHWRVRYSKRADGTYQYRTPDEVKK